MGIRETLGGFIPDNLKPPLVPTSYQKFIDTLRAQKVLKIVATPGRKTLFQTRNLDEVDGTSYEYNIVFEAVGENGRRINLYFPCARKFLDNPDYHYIHGGKMRGEHLIQDLEEAYSLTTIVTADAKLTELQEIFPKCTVELRDAEKVFESGDLKELRKVAVQRQIRPW